MLPNFMIKWNIYFSQTMHKIYLKFSCLIKNKSEWDTLFRKHAHTLRY